MSYFKTDLAVLHFLKHSILDLITDITKSCKEYIIHVLKHI